MFQYSSHIGKARVGISVMDRQQLPSRDVAVGGYLGARHFPFPCVNQKVDGLVVVPSDIHILGDDTRTVALCGDR